MFNLVARKKTGIVSIVALLASLFSVIPITTANAVLNAVGGTNIASTAETVNVSLITATQVEATAVIHSMVNSPSSAVNAARSAGLLEKSIDTGLNQTATVLPGGVLSLYASVTTSTAITADGGSFTSAATTTTASTSVTTAPTTNGRFFSLTATGTATPIAVLWQAPTTAGTYTVSMYVSQATANTITAATANGGTLRASIAVTVRNVHGAAGTGTNTALLVTSETNSNLYTAVQNSSTGASIVSSATDVVSTHVTARSLGLLTKDTTVSTAQTATILAGGSLSLYSYVATDVAFVASGGTFSGAAGATSSTYSQDVKSVFLDAADAAQTAVTVAVRWTAPTTAGSYTISMNRSNNTYQVAADTYAGTLTGAITVTVVAASGGGTFSAAYSPCNTRSSSQGHGLATGVDSTGVNANGETGYIVFDLDDAYDTALDTGNLVATATTGAFLAFANNASTAAAGTSATVVRSNSPSNQVVQVIQAVANVPVTTTVTISYNGTTVCTKTVTIRGEVAKLTIASIGTEDLSTSGGSATWIADGTNRAGVYTVVAADSAGNVVIPTSATAFSADASTLGTTVQALSVNNAATSASSSSAHSASTGIWTCGATAGEAKVKLTYTNAGSGKVVSSDAFTARCADNPYTYTASFDKASYVQGELATLTVQFLDSKGNKANTVTAHGALTATTPMLTAVTGFTDTVANKTDGTRVYTFTVGLATGITAGSYTGIIDYASLTAVAAVKATPGYKVTTGSTDVSNAEVLKSIVALIASINKQIQALQKLLLKR